MLSNIAKLSVLAMNTVRLNEASKIIGSPDESATFLSTLCPLFETVINSELAKAMENECIYAGLTTEDDIGVESSKCDAAMSKKEIYYTFVLTGNFAGFVEVEFTICTDPSNIHFHALVSANNDNGDMLAKRMLDYTTLRALATSFNDAVADMVETCKKG